MEGQIKFTSGQNKALMFAKMGINLNITGAAGVGKSKLIQELKKKEGTILVAPTGISALNIGGMTAHKLFNLPRGVATSKSRYKKLHIKDKPSRLIIDEAFMIRADYFEYIDKVLRKTYNSDEPFAGIQTVVVGDPFQLSPIIANKDSEIFYSNYNSPYLFNTDTWKNLNFQNVLLDEVIRQSDTKQVRLLESIRTKDQYWQHAVQRVNQWTSQYEENKHKDLLQLSFYRKEVDKRNEEGFNRLSTPVVTFKGAIEGNFKEFPVPVDLKLRTGLKVLVCANGYDSFRKKPKLLYCNGTQGEVVDLGRDHITIKTKTGYIDVEQHVWNNIEYDKRGNEKLVGSYRQFPIKLAFSATVHSSQGMTLEDFVLDTGRGAFTNALTYVALSRAKDLRKVVLKKPLRYSDVKVDEEVKRFYEML